jgi:hypothetical protein
VEVTTKLFAGLASLNFDNPNSAGNNTKTVIEQFACGLPCYVPTLYIQLYTAFVLRSYFVNTGLYELKLCSINDRLS